MNIWEAAKETGLTKKAIRYYEKMGLLVPAINQDNNYRDYSRADVERLKQISVLRRVGVPVAEIKEALQGSGELARVLEQHLARLEGEIEEKEKSRQAIKGCLEDLARQANPQEVIKRLDSFWRSLELDARGRQGYMRKELERVFPGPFGRLMGITYGYFLDEPLETPEKERAWISLVAALDAAEEIQYPERLVEALKASPPDLANLEAEVARKWERLISMSEQEKQELRDNPFPPSSDPKENEAELAMMEFMPYLTKMLSQVVPHLMVLSPRFRQAVGNMLEAAGFSPMPAT